MYSYKKKTIELILIYHNCILLFKRVQNTRKNEEYKSSIISEIHIVVS